MISKMKALGLVLAAAFAVSAVAASTASAEEETGAMTPGHFFSHSGSEKTHIEGEQEGIVNVFTITESETNEGKALATVECPNEDVSFTGTPSDTEGNTVEGNTSTDVRVHPVYSPETAKNCQVKINGNNFGKAIVHTEGCDYVLSAHTDAEGDAPVHIECEEGKSITITAALGCVFHIGSQTPDAGVHYTNEGETHEIVEEEEVTTEAITAEATVREIKWSQNGNCIPLPPEGHFADYDSKITVRGYEELEEETKGPQTSIRWTETAE